ncbi:COG1470 family protein, partial [Streptomyces bambusae]
MSRGAPARPGPALPGLLLCGLVLFVLLLGSAGTARADGPGWTAEPAAGAAARPSGPRPYFYLQGGPGSVLEDRIALANPTDRERTLTLRGADAYNTADGALAVRPADRSTGAGAGAGAWVGFGGAGTVTIPPRTRAVVPFTVTVPPGAAPGDHPVAVVAAEAGHEAAVRVHLRVSGPQVAALTVEDVRVRGRGGATVVTYTLVNRGNVALAPQLALTADGLLGEPPGRTRRPVPVELLPGQRVELTEPWPGAPVFDRVRLTAEVTAAGGARAEATATAWFLPWGIAARTGAGLLGLAGLFLAARLLVR